MKQLYLVRGLPGSGKTKRGRDMVKQAQQSGMTAVQYEADDYFFRDSKYKFNPMRLFYAHQACQKNTNNAMSIGVNVVIVTNTFIRIFELSDYISMAEQYSYEVTVMRMRGNHENPKNIDIRTTERMKANFEALAKEIIV